MLIAKRHPRIINHLPTDMHVYQNCFCAIVLSKTHLSNPRQYHKIKIMEAEKKEKTQSFI